MVRRLLLSLPILLLAHVATARSGIALQLSEQLVQRLLRHSTETDSFGVPCSHTSADQGSCGGGQKPANHVLYYASCDVISDSAVSCPEPEAAAHDHHEGAIPITKTVRLYVESGKQQPAPLLVNRVVPEISYSQRGEYTLTYDAADSSGNAADSVVFKFFLVDHTAPAIFVSGHDWGKEPLLGTSPFFTLPRFTAYDNYDGDVTSTMQVRLVRPGGRQHVFGNGAPITVDTRVHGQYALEFLAHDFAGPFGLDYRNNGRLTKATLTVAPGGVSLHVTSTGVSKLVSLGSTPAPTPKVLPTAAPTPTPAPCVASGWSAWSECTHHCGGGLQSRARSVISPARYGGEACASLSAVRNCGDEVCPVDCLHTFLPWTLCSRSCGTGTKMRMVEVTRQAAHGGLNCPTNQERVCSTVPCATSAPTPAPTHKLVIPPMLILHWKNHVVARGSGFGSHGDEHTYRHHLHSKGYSEAEISNHVAAIVEREQKLEQMLGQGGKWWM